MKRRLILLFILAGLLWLWVHGLEQAKASSLTLFPTADRISPNTRFAYVLTYQASEAGMVVVQLPIPLALEIGPLTTTSGRCFSYIQLGTPSQGIECQTTLQAGQALTVTVEVTARDLCGTRILRNRARTARLQSNEAIVKYQGGWCRQWFPFLLNRASAAAP